MRNILLSIALLLPLGALADQPTPAVVKTAAKAPVLDHLVRLTGGAAATDRLPMVIALHGLGDRPESFARLFEGYPGKLRIIVARAPKPYGRGGTWFRLEKPPGAGMTADMRTSAKAVADLIAHAQTRYPTRGKPIVTGFSQGGMLSYAMAVLYPRAIRGAVPIAGLLPKALWPVRVGDKGEAVAPIRALHGTADDRVPYSAAEALTIHLLDLKVDAQLTPFFGVKHRVPPPVRAAAFEAIAAFAK